MLAHGFRCSNSMKAKSYGLALIRLPAPRAPRPAPACAAPPIVTSREARRRREGIACPPAARSIPSASPAQERLSFRRRHEQFPQGLNERAQGLNDRGAPSCHSRAGIRDDGTRKSVRDAGLGEPAGPQSSLLEPVGRPRQAERRRSRPHGGAPVSVPGFTAPRHEPRRSVVRTCALHSRLSGQPVNTLNPARRSSMYESKYYVGCDSQYNRKPSPNETISPAVFTTLL
jgi:hypothetical protein